MPACGGSLVDSLADKAPQAYRFGYHPYPVMLGAAVVQHILEQMTHVADMFFDNGHFLVQFFPTDSSRVLLDEVGGIIDGRERASELVRGDGNEMRLHLRGLGVFRRRLCLDVLDSCFFKVG